jgi:DNA adenine methylase
VKPFLKWAGNKYQIIDRITRILPPGDKLIEPFVGSGAVFMNTDYPEYILADTNVDLINMYKYIQTHGHSFIKYAKSFFTAENNCKDKYYALRDEFNSTKSIKKKSAIFIYLNKYCYNGLCRYNSKGKFNTPFGRYTKPYFPEKEMLHFFNKSQTATFLIQGFEEIMNEAKKGDVVYCDPPYVPLSSTANFTAYSSAGFSMAQQIQLARLAEKLSGRGVPVIISNHRTEFIHQEYKKADIHSFDVQRFISTKGDNRTKAPEILALFAGC